jgi:hypothetical protein
MKRLSPLNGVRAPNNPQVAIKDDEEEERKELAAAEDAARRTTIDVLFLNGGHLYQCAPGWSASSLLTFSNPRIARMHWVRLTRQKREQVCFGPFHVLNIVFIARVLRPRMPHIFNALACPRRTLSFRFI